MKLLGTREPAKRNLWRGILKKAKAAVVAAEQAEVINHLNWDKWYWPSRANQCCSVHVYLTLQSTADSLHCLLPITFPNLLIINYWEQQISLEFSWQVLKKVLRKMRHPEQHHYANHWPWRLMFANCATVVLTADFRVPRQSYPLCIVECDATVRCISPWDSPLMHYSVRCRFVSSPANCSEKEEN